ncbi:MAG: histidine kinase [Pirellulaceae bacterium]
MRDQDASDSDLSLAEFDRVWLSHELHDGLLQWVIGAKMQVECASCQKQGRTPPTTDQLQYLSTLLARAALEGRRLWLACVP